LCHWWPCKLQPGHGNIGGYRLSDGQATTDATTHRNRTLAGQGSRLAHTCRHQGGGDLHQLPGLLANSGANS
jgi:hypothetical protein